LRATRRNENHGSLNPTSGQNQNEKQRELACAAPQLGNVNSLIIDLAPASHQLDVGGFRVNNQIDVRLDGDPPNARFCSSVDLSHVPLRHLLPTPTE